MSLSNDEKIAINALLSISVSFDFLFDLKIKPIKNNISKKRKSFPKETTTILIEYYTNSKYLEENDIIELMQKTNLTGNQIKQWFINRRRRT
jgi:hypothetical protein